MKLTHKNILTITTIITLLFYLAGINSWKFAFVGDDWPFYQFANQLIANNFLMYPFSFNGVYGQNTVLSSMYQAFFMAMFGSSNFSWRFSNIALIIPITIFMYLWLRKLFNPQIALISTIVLQSSFYLANFFKVGKNMPQALAMLMVCLFMTVKTVENPTGRNFFILGLLLGFSFYIYIGPIFPLIIWPFFLPLLRKEKFKSLLSKGMYVVLGYALLVVLSFINIDGWNGPIGKTFAHKEYEGYIPMLINIWHNFLLFFNNYDYMYNHFVAGPYVDFTTSGCIVIGIILALKKFRSTPYMGLILSYISVCVLIGITSPYEYAPTTRGIFFLPFGAAFAGIALSYLVTKHKDALIGLLAFIFCFNVYLSQIGVFHISGYSGTALVLREMQWMQLAQHKQPITLLLAKDTSYFGHDYFPVMQQAYGLQDIEIRTVPMDKAQCADLNNARVLMFINDQHLLRSYEALPCSNKPQPIFLSPAIFL